MYQVILYLESLKKTKAEINYEAKNIGIDDYSLLFTATQKKERKYKPFILGW